MKLTTIGEAAKTIGISAFTLRYYDKEGLLPFVERTASGKRLFKDTDLEWLALLECLKTTGMPLKDIKRFIDWVEEGDASLAKRHTMFLERKAAVEQQIATLQKALEKINYKCWYYETAVKAGTEKVHQKSLKVQAFQDRGAS
jgi:DNA-binding transcriptional MerR regulator